MMLDETLILASGSPRRRQLLDLIGLSFKVVPSQVDEEPRPGEEPSEYAARAAEDKARDVASRVPGQLVLGADTVVEVESEILGKPRTADAAAKMLRRLSGKKHSVNTAMALVRDDSCHQLVDTTEVQFVELTGEMIRWYVATGEPLDKAGAYGIQGIGGLFVVRIEGSPHTVVGLPIHRLPELFDAAGLGFWDLVASV
jgi:septum formation protein